MYVLDTSVVCKWYVQEKDSDRANKILDGYQKRKFEISIPDLLLYEINNALRSNPKNSLRDIERVLSTLFALRLDIVVPTLALLKDATRLAIKQNLSIYDATYVALAEDLGYTLVTADEKLYERIKRLPYVKLLSQL